MKPIDLKEILEWLKLVYEELKENNRLRKVPSALEGFEGFFSWALSVGVGYSGLGFDCPRTG